MIAIVGAGISGLCLGHYLKKSGCTNFTIFCDDSEIGGKIKTTPLDHFNLESGPNTLMSTPLLLELIKELGLENDLIFPDEAIVKNRFIKINGKTTLLPQKPQKLLFNNLLSLKSKLSILKDLRFKPTPVHDEETVAEFFLKHFTSEIVDKLVTPFCRGIYATDPEGLLVKSVFPKLAEFQKEYGSVVKGLQKNKSLEKRKVFLLKNGMTSIISNLKNELKDHLVKEKATLLEKEKGSFKVHTKNDITSFNKLVISCPPKEASKLLSNISTEISFQLNKIDSAQLNVQHRIYKTDKEAFPFKGFGVLYARNEHAQILGHIWNSNMHSVKEDEFLITTMFRGNAGDEFNDSLDDILESGYKLKKADLLHINDTPWKRAIPTYNTRHLQFLRQYEKETEINLYFCSNLVNGVSVPDRVKQAKSLVTKLI